MAHSPSDGASLRQTLDHQSATSFWTAALLGAVRSSLVAAILLALVYAGLFKVIHPEFLPFTAKNAEKIVFSGRHLLRVSEGESRLDGDSIIIEKFAQDESILVLEQGFQAEDYPFIKVNLSGLNEDVKFKIMWRRDSTPAITHSLEFNRSGDSATQIAMVYAGEEYRGAIKDLALLFYVGGTTGAGGNSPTNVTVYTVELRPFSLLHFLEQLIEDVTNPPLWQLSSSNRIKGAHENSIITPNILCLALIIAGCIVARVTTRSSTGAPVSRNLWPTIVCLCLIGGALSDALRWQWRIDQLADAYRRHYGKPIETRIKNTEARCQRFPDNCRSDLLPYY